MYECVYVCVCLSVDGAFLISDIWICVLAQSIHHTTPHTTHSHGVVWTFLVFFGFVKNPELL